MYKPAPASFPTLEDLTRDEAINAAVRGLQRGYPFQAIQPQLNVTGMEGQPEGNRPGFGGGTRAPPGRDFSNFSGGAPEVWGQNPFSSSNMVLEVGPSGGFLAKSMAQQTRGRWWENGRI